MIPTEDVPPGVKTNLKQIADNKKCCHDDIHIDVINEDMTKNTILTP